MNNLPWATLSLLIIFIAHCSACATGKDLKNDTKLIVGSMSAADFVGLKRAVRELVADKLNRDAMLKWLSTCEIVIVDKRVLLDDGKWEFSTVEGPRAFASGPYEYEWTEKGGATCRWQVRSLSVAVSSTDQDHAPPQRTVSLELKVTVEEHGKYTEVIRKLGAVHVIKYDLTGRQ